jgi:hypothetical protein
MRKRLRKQIYLTRVFFDQVTRGAIIGSDSRRKIKKLRDKNGHLVWPDNPPSFSFRSKNHVDS